MGQTVFWKRDWFLGLVLSLFMLLAAGSDLVQSLERKAYDLAMQATTRTPTSQIAVVAIDDASIANLGRWPWPRDLHARLTDLLAGAGAKAIGNTIFFSEAQVDPGYQYITRLLDQVNQRQAEAVAPLPELAELTPLLQEAEAALNTDRRLARSYAQAGTVLLPMLFELGEIQGRPDAPLPDFVLRNRLARVSDGGGHALTAPRLQGPIALLGEPAVALGHLNSSLDVDGAVRSEPLLIQYHDSLFPALSLQLAARSLNLGVADLRVNLGQSVDLGRLHIVTDSAARMWPFFYRDHDGRPPFQVDSFYDVLSGKIPASKYAGKLVLIGATAAGVGNQQVTPVSPAMAPVLALAHTVSSILQAHFIVTPPWAPWASLAAIVLVGLYLAVLLPRLGAGAGTLGTLLLVSLLLATHALLMMRFSLWLPLMSAAVLGVLGHLLLTTKHFLSAERGKQRSDFESAESNRMLGLAFQGQGQLDMAFDKFRKCPMDQGLMENLYNLGLDYERKRQFNKAEAVFRYVADFDLGFRDLAQRIARAKQMADTVMLAGARGQTAGGTLILGDGQVEKPMLGRYLIEKELGKGAMGVVYLGRDPKINRVVAIKTMALAQSFDADELDDVKQRFFREAETAGRLNHPHIVTMYDAGEEQDLAYIAMEFLHGRDLVPQTKLGQLLPLPQVWSIVARVAEALDYAHAQHVVHRDIKPANIMYEPSSDQVKVTDFGIARITDASRTKTGMVLGTPSYMSPEQLAGKKIDGRSDLFSLGVTLYQLSCGRLPFSGDSLAQLMFRIANEAPSDIRQFNPDLPASALAVIERALQKDLAQRYQRGRDMADALRACLAENA